MPEAKVTLVRKTNFVTKCLPETCLKRPENSLLKTVISLPVSNNSECTRDALSFKKLKNIKRVENDQIIKNKRAICGQNKIKRGEKAQNFSKSDREAQSKNKISSLTSGRGEVPVAYEDVKTCPEQNSKSKIQQNMPAAGIMHASVQKTKSEAPTGHDYNIDKILSIIFKVLPKKPIHTIQMPLIEIICTMLCPSDRLQYRLWANKGHLLYFIYKIAPFIIACGTRSCLWPYNYPLDLLPGALESLAFIMATIILSVQFAFVTELISPLNAHKNIQNNVLGLKRLFYHSNSNGNPSFILACCVMPHAYACCATGYTIIRLDYHKTNPSLTFYTVILFMTGGSVRFTHGFAVYSYSSGIES